MNPGLDKQHEWVEENFGRTRRCKGCDAVQYGRHTLPRDWQPPVGNVCPRTTLIAQATDRHRQAAPVMTASEKAASLAEIFAGIPVDRVYRAAAAMICDLKEVKVPPGGGAAIAVPDIERFIVRLDAEQLRILRRYALLPQFDEPAPAATPVVPPTIRSPLATEKLRGVPEERLQAVVRFLMLQQDLKRGVTTECDLQRDPEAFINQLSPGLLDVLRTMALSWPVATPR